MNTMNRSMLLLFEMAALQTDFLKHSEVPLLTVKADIMPSSFSSSEVFRLSELKAELNEYLGPMAN